MVLPQNAYIKANIIDTTPGQTPDKCPSSTQNAAAWSTFPISRNRVFFYYSHNVGKFNCFPLCTSGNKHLPQFPYNVISSRQFGGWRNKIRTHFRQGHLPPALVTLIWHSGTYVMVSASLQIWHPSRWNLSGWLLGGHTPTNHSSVRQRKTHGAQVI